MPEPKQIIHTLPVSPTLKPIDTELFDDNDCGQIEYAGKAGAGSSETVDCWYIEKFTYNDKGTITSVKTGINTIKLGSTDYELISDGNKNYTLILNSTINSDVVIAFLIGEENQLLLNLSPIHTFKIESFDGVDTFALTYKRDNLANIPNTPIDDDKILISKKNKTRLRNNLRWDFRTSYIYS